MRLLIVFVFEICIHGQTLPTGFVRGVLVPSAPGEFSVRSKMDVVYRFRSDARTWIERESERISAAALKQGEVVEVVSDRDVRSLDVVRYARMVQVITQVRRPPVRAGMYRLYRPMENKIPRDDTYFYSGVVIQITGERLVLRTRLDGEKVVFLRPDTRCLEEGLVVEAEALRPYTRVSIEAGKDNSGQIEARQVVWGSILENSGLPD